MSSPWMAPDSSFSLVPGEEGGINASLQQTAPPSHSSPHQLSSAPSPLLSSDPSSRPSLPVFSQPYQPTYSYPASHQYSALLHSQPPFSPSSSSPPSPSPSLHSRSPSPATPLHPFPLSIVTPEELQSAATQQTDSSWATAWLQRCGERVHRECSISEASLLALFPTFFTYRGRLRSFDASFASRHFLAACGMHSNGPRAGKCTFCDFSFQASVQRADAWQMHCDSHPQCSYVQSSSSSSSSSSSFLQWIADRDRLGVDHAANYFGHELETLSRMGAPLLSFQRQRLCLAVVLRDSLAPPATPFSCDVLIQQLSSKIREIDAAESLSSVSETLGWLQRAIGTSRAPLAAQRLRTQLEPLAAFPHLLSTVAFVSFRSRAESIWTQYSSGPFLDGLFASAAPSSSAQPVESESFQSAPSSSQLPRHAHLYTSVQPFGQSVQLHSTTPLSSSSSSVQSHSLSSPGRNLPRVYSDPALHIHTLSLTHRTTAWSCNNCSRQHGSGGDCYRCEACDFDLCTDCLSAFINTPAALQLPLLHPHKLQAINRDTSWTCDSRLPLGCGGIRVSNDRLRFGCLSCHFDVCDLCLHHHMETHPNRDFFFVRTIHPHPLGINRTSPSDWICIQNPDPAHLQISPLPSRFSCIVCPSWRTCSKCIDPISSPFTSYSGPKPTSKSTPSASPQYPLISSDPQTYAMAAPSTQHAVLAASDPHPASFSLQVSPSDHPSARLEYWGLQAYQDLAVPSSASYDDPSFSPLSSTDQWISEPVAAPEPPHPHAAPPPLAPAPASSPIPVHMREIPLEELQLDLTSIGSGVGGVVRRGIWRGATVAVKMVSCPENDEVMRQSFIQECAILAQVTNHPNVIKFIGCSTSLPHLYLVSQYCENLSLLDYLVRRQSPVEMTALVRMMKEAAAGVLHLHAENVIHRDLAARNILIDSHLRCYVTDFGMSRVKELSRSYGKTRSVYGPVKWMAPECFSHKQYSFKTDVWSFGVLISEMVCRAEPYPGMDLLDVAIGIKSRQLRPSLPAGAPIQLQELTARCWAFEPDERPSMAHVFDILHRFWLSLPPV